MAKANDGLTRVSGLSFCVLGLFPAISLAPRRANFRLPGKTSRIIQVRDRGVKGEWGTGGWWEHINRAPILTLAVSVRRGAQRNW